MESSGQGDAMGRLWDELSLGQEQGEGGHAEPALVPAGGLVADWGPASLRGPHWGPSPSPGR